MDRMDRYWSEDVPNVCAALRRLDCICELFSEFCTYLSTYENTYVVGWTNGGEDVWACHVLCYLVCRNTLFLIFIEYILQSVGFEVVEWSRTV